ncbi:MAG: hypothetical protein HFE27_00005 [Clostridia bacterium]|nr:hypothetical protein [Clostridia bacterium]
MANCIDPGTYTVSQEISSDEAYSNYVFYDRETQTVLMETYQEQDVDADGNPVVDADGNPVMVDKERPIRNHQITILIRPKRLDLNTLKWDYDPEAPPQYNYNEQQMKLTDDCVPEWLTPIYVGAGTNVGNYNTTVSFTENMEYIQSYLGSYELANWREYFVVPDLDESPAEATTFYCEEGEVEDWVSLDWILAPKRILAEWDTTHTTAKYGSHNDVTDLPFMVGDKLVTESTKYTLEYGSDMPALNTDIQGRVEYRFYDRFGYNQGVNTPYFTLDQFIENRAQLAVDPTLYYVMAYVTDENFVLCSQLDYNYSQRATYEYLGAGTAATNQLKHEVTLNPDKDGYPYRWAEMIQKSVAEGTTETFVLDHGDWMGEYYRDLASQVRSFSGTVTTYNAAYLNPRGFTFSAANNYGSLYLPTGANIIIDLNGNAINRNMQGAASIGGVIYVATGSTLTVRDSHAPAGGGAPVLDADGKLTYHTNEEGANTDVVLNTAGQITGGYTTGATAAGGITVIGDSTFNFESGVIRNNIAVGNYNWMPGGVLLYGTGGTSLDNRVYTKFNMTGGVISENKTSASGNYYAGGGVQALYADVSITGGYVVANTLGNSTNGNSAAGIMLHCCLTNLENVQVLENRGITGGLSVYYDGLNTASGKVATVKNVAFKNNSNSYYPLAGAAYFSGDNSRTAPFLIENCVLTGNELPATSGYASVNYYTSTGGMLLDSGIYTVRNCVITDNTTAYGTGGMYIYKSTSTIENTIIAQNTSSAQANGGVGKYFYPGMFTMYLSEVNMTNSHVGACEVNGVSYEGNVSHGNGVTGVSIMYNSKFTFEDGSISGNSSDGQAYGVLFMDPSIGGACEVHLKNVEMNNNVHSNPSSYYMFVFDSAAHTATFENVTIEHNESASTQACGFIQLGSGNTLTWTGGSLSHNVINFTSGYALLCVGYGNYGATAELRDVDITHNTCSSYPVFVAAHSQFVMEGGSISDNTSSQADGGGAINISGTNASTHAVVRLTDVNIERNAGVAAGGIRIWNYGELSMVGGSIADNDSTVTNSSSAGGINASVGANVSLENVAVKGNKATADNGYGNVGGIFIDNNASLSLNRVTVGASHDANAATDANVGDYGGVYLKTNATLTIQDTVIIKNNTGRLEAVTGCDNLYYGPTANKITVAGSLTNSYIKIASPFIGVFTDGFGANNPSGLLPTQVFISDRNYDDADHTPVNLIKNDGDGANLEGVIMGNDNASRWTYAVQTSLANNGAPEDFKLISDWDAVNSAFNGTIAATQANGYYTNGQLWVPRINGVQASINLDLNGYTINRGGAAQAYGTVILVHGHLKVTDSSMEYEYDHGNVVVDENNDPVLRAPTVDADGNVIPNGTGKITGGYTTSNLGGAITVGGNDDYMLATVDIQGGNIVGNRSTGNYSAGAIQMWQGARVSIKNANISENTCSGTASSAILAYYSTSSDSLTVDRSVFVKNNDSNYVISSYEVGLRITNCKFIETLGGYTIRFTSGIEDKTAYIENIEILDCNGGIVINNGSSELKNVLIDGCEYVNGFGIMLGDSTGSVVANVHASGLRVKNISSNVGPLIGFYRSPVSVFVNSTLELDTYVDPVTGEVIESSITDNTNTARSGVSGVSVARNSTFKMTGGEISRNSSTGIGSCILYLYDNNITFELTDVDITGNTADQPFALKGSGTNIAFTNVNLTENTTFGSGGGRALFHLYEAATLIMKGGCISNNHAPNITDYGILAIGYTNTAAVHAELYGVTIDGNQGGYSTVYVGNNGSTLLMDDLVDPDSGEVTHTSITNNTATNSNGGYTVYVYSTSASNYGSLELNNVIVDGNVAHITAGIYVHHYANFSMTGGSVSENRVTGYFTSMASVAGIWTASSVNQNTDGLVTLENVKINGNSCDSLIKSTAGVYSYSPLVLDHCEVKDNRGGYYAGVQMYSTATLEVKNSTISGNEGVRVGGIYSVSSTTLDHSSVSNNTASGALASGDKGAAGGIFVNGGTLAISEGSEVSGNTCTIEGGAGGIYTKGIVEMTGGNIIGNTATGSASAGGVYVFGALSAQFKMSGGTITLNTGRAADTANNITMGAGGVYVAGAAPTAGTIELQGNVVIDNNTLADGAGATASKSNVYIVDAENTKVIVSGALANTSSVGIYRRPIGVFTSGFGANNPTLLAQSIFHSDTVYSEVVSYDTALEQIVTAAGADVEGFTKSYDNEINWAYYVKLSLATGTQQTFVLYGDWVAKETSTSTTRFGTDVTAYTNGALYVPVGANMVIELNGSKLDRNLSANSGASRDSGYVINVAGELTVKDNHRTDPSLIRDGINRPENGVTYDGEITGGSNSTTQRAGGIYVARNAMFTLEDGKITKNRGMGGSLVAGGVFVDGTFDMYGGEISENEGGSAGGVYVSGTGAFTMFAGKIVNNVSVSSTNASGVGGVRVALNGVMYFGDGNEELGKIEITGNKLTTDANSNLKSEDENYQFAVNGTFGDGTSIGVTRGTTTKFTVGYGQHHLGGGTVATNPQTYFFSDDEDHFVTREGQGSETEAVMLGYNNRDNWTYAVETSLAFGGATQTFTLYSDWTAERPASTNYTTEFGSNSNAYYRGALYVPFGASIVLDLKGHTLNRNLAQSETRADGYVIYVLGELIIRDDPNADDDTAGIGTITGGASRNTAGGIVVGAGGNVYLEDGEISGNYAGFAAGSAGGVYVEGSENTHFVMTGGAVKDNRGYDAGGVYVDNGTGGGRNGTFTMTGGLITGNTAVSTNTGGVRVNTTSKIELGGSAVIKDNSNGEVTNTSNLYLMYANTTGSLASVPPNIQIVSGFTDEANIHITRETIGQFTDGFETSGTTRAPEDVFVSDNADYFVDEIKIEIENEDGTTSITHEAFMKCYLASVNWSYTVQTSLTTGTTQTYTLDYGDWIAELSNSDGTSFGRGVGYEQGRLWVPVGASIILDLKGHTIDRALGDGNAVQNGEVFFVQGALKIIDSSAAQTGKITGGNSTGTGGIYNSGTLTIEGGSVTGNRSTAIANGAGIYNKGTFTMTGGSVTGNSGYHAGVYVDSTGVVNLGGNIVINDNFYDTQDEDGNAIQKQSNLYFKNNTAIINVVKPFVTGAKISLVREGIGVLTNGYGKFNTVNPETYFVSESENSLYEISHINSGERLEAAIVSYDNATNWSHAVRTSLANNGAVQIFTLYSDWFADENHSFGNEVGYLNGGLNVPYGANIILDLNGYCIKRGLTSSAAVSNGFVFDIGGKLQIIGEGAITGGNSTNTAGAIHIEETGWVDISGNVIIDDVRTDSPTDGGAVTVKGKFTFTNGYINIGAASNVCAGVYVATSGTLEMGGNAGFGVCNASNPPDSLIHGTHIYLESPTGMITFVSAMNPRDRIYVYRDAIGPFTTGYSAFAPDVDFSTADGDVYLVEATSNGMELQLTTHDNRRNWEYAVQTSLDTGTTQEFKLWEDWNAEGGVFGTEAPYYLNGALNVPVGASISFNLNGYALNRGLANVRSNGYVMFVSGELILDDLSSAQTGMFTGGNNSSANSTGGVYVNRDAVFTMNGGRISNNAVYGAGGGGVYNNGTFTLNGGVIGAFETDEVSIAGNRGLAGGVFNGAYGTFEMNGGAINGNESTNNAGGVYVYNSADSGFTMTGGKITNNTAESAGGVYAAGKFDMLGGEISGNTATSTDVTSGGGSGVYISATGEFTLTGGVVKDNNGLNGIRVYSSGKLNLGGTAQVYNNKNEAVFNSTDPSEYRNIYFTVSTQHVNIVSKFEDGAHIGVTRDISGIFTDNYGVWNPTSSPANYFVSDVEAYAVSSAQSNLTNTIEGVIGTPVQQPCKTESAVYDGESHVIISGFDPKYMNYETLPNGVTYDEEEKAFKAVNAGEYSITFTLKPGFCWPDGSSGSCNVIAQILRRVVELEWEHLTDLVYNTREQAPTAKVTNLVAGDVCDVGVTGGQIHAGSYTATASFLSNPNYTLEHADPNDVEKGYTISKAEISVEILNEIAAYKTPEVLKLNANISNDGITFIIIDNIYVTYSVDAAGASLIDSDDLANGLLTALSSSGTVYITASVAETPDTLAATSQPKEIQLQKALPKLGLEETTVEYGTDLELVVVGNDEVTATITLVNDTGEAILNGNILTPVKAGKVKIVLSTEESDNYFANVVTVTVTIDPKVLVIEWDGPFEFNYDGYVHGPDAHAVNLVGDDECNIIVGGKQKNAGEYLGEDGAHAMLVTNPNYTLEGAENLYHDFEIHKIEIPLDERLSLVENVVDFGDTLSLAITGNRENAEVQYEIVLPEIPDPNHPAGEATIRYEYQLDANGDPILDANNEPIRADIFTAIFEPVEVGYVLVKVTIGESDNYTGGGFTEYVCIRKAALDVTFYTDRATQSREVIYGDENCELEVVGNTENGRVDYTVLGGTGDVEIVGSVLKALAVGEVRVLLHIAATDHYDEIYVAETIIVKPRPVILSWSGGTYVYDGTEKKPTAIVANAVFGDQLFVTVQGAINAGNHTATAISITDQHGNVNNNYTLDVEAGALLTTTPFVIERRKIEAITWGNRELLFNGEYQAPTYTFVGLILGDVCELEIENMGKHVGTYTATAVGVTNENYFVDATTINQSVTYNIIKAPITLEITNEVAYYYNDTQIDLVGNIGEGDVTYTITTSPAGIATVSPDGVIFANDYGYITIRVDVAATNDTYSGWVEKTIPVIKGEASLDIVNTEVIYGDTLQIEFKSQWHPNQIYYTLNDRTTDATLTGLADFNSITLLLTAMGAGEVTLTVYTQETERYLETRKEITITIHKRILDVDWVDEFTYDGTQKLPYAENIGNLAFDDDAPVLTLDGAQIDAGNYEATVVGISNNNYALFVDEENQVNGYSVPFVINKADLEIEIEPTVIYIDQENVPVIISNNLSGNQPEYELVNGTGSAILSMDGNGNFFITPSTVGEVKLIVRIPASDNYNTFEQEFTITIARLTPEVGLTTDTVHYGDTLELSVYGEGTDGRSVTYSVTDGTGSAEQIDNNHIKGTAVGTVTVTVTLAETELYEEQTFDVVVTVTKRPVVLSWNIGTYVYNGQEQAPTATVINTVGDDVVVVVVQGNIHAGTGLTAAAIEAQNDNYTVIGGTNVTVHYNIDPKIVEVDWDQDTLSFVYDGQQHVPSATVRDGFLIGDDEAEVIVSGAQTDAYDAWVAEVLRLSNTDYAVDPDNANSRVTFKITTADPEVTLNEIVVRYHELSDVLSIICTPAGGNVTYTIISGNDKAELRDGNKIYGLELGPFTLKIHVDSTMGSAGVLNTNEANIEVEITVIKGWQPFELTDDTVVYGSDLTLELTGWDEEANYRFVEIIDTNDDGDATLNGNILTPVHVGTVKVKVVYDETDHYEQTTRELTVTITPYVLEFVWDNDPADQKLIFTYNGEEQAPTALPVHLFGDDVCEILVHGARNAGSHTATAYGTSNPNYTIVGSQSMTDHPSQDFVIKKLVVTFEWNETTLGYTAQPQTPTATITNKVEGDDVSFTYEGHQTEMGFYTDDERAKITGLQGQDSGNYTLEGVDEAMLETDFEIGRGHPNLVLSVSSTSISYLQSVTVTLTGNIGGGDVTYEIVSGTGEFIYSEDGTVRFKPGQAGNVSIQAHVTETSHTYEADSNIVTIHVAKAHWSVGLSHDTAYFGTSTPLTWAPGVWPYKIAIDRRTPKNDRNGSWISYYSFVGYGVGSYRIYLAWNENSNFEKGEAYRTITVYRRPLTIEWVNLEFIYNGNAQAPEVTTHTQVRGDNFSVRFTGIGTDAGSYVATAVGLNESVYVNFVGYFSADTYYVLTGDNLASSYTIGRAELDPHIITTDAEYGVPLQLELEGNLGNGAIRYELLEGGTGSATINGDILNPTGIGTVVVRAYIEETRNYHAGECTAIITIGKKIPPLDVENLTVIYGDELQLSVTGNVENGQIMFAVTDGTGSATITPTSGILTPVHVGVVTVTISVSETDNYRGTTIQREVTILPRPIQIEWDEDTLEFEYDGTIKTPVANVISGLVGNDTVEISVMGSQINAGVYNATASSQNENYVIDENETTEFVITPKAIEIKIDQTEAYLGVPVTLTVTSNVPINSSLLQFSVSAAGGDATLSGNVITGTQYGNVVVSVVLPANGNYQAATDMKIFEIKKFVPNIGLANDEVVYGSTLNLEVTGNLGEANISIALGHKLTDTGMASLNGTTLRGLKAGTVTLIVTVGASDNYEGGDFEVEVTVLPRPVVLVWGGENGVFEFEYNGEEQYPEAKVLNVIAGDVCNVISISGATDAGDHFAEALEVDNDNYTVVNGQNVVNIPFTITKKVVELEWSEETFVYNNEMQAPTATISNLLPVDQDKNIQVLVTGETHATKTWLDEVATATATFISNGNYTLIGCTNTTKDYVIEQLEAELTWDDPCEVIYNGPNTELPGVVVGNKFADDECDVLVRPYQGTSTFALSAHAGSNAQSVTHVAEAYGFTGENEDDYKLPEDNTKTYTEVAQEVTITWGDLEFEYNGEAQYPTYTLDGVMAGDHVELQFACDEDPINVKYASDNVTILKYSAVVTLTGEDAEHYKINILQQSPEIGTGEMRTVVEFKIVPRPVTVYATSKDVQLLLELDNEGHMILDRFQTRHWSDWFFLTCQDLVGQDIGAEIGSIFDIENLYLSPAFYRIERDENGNIISISDERVIPGLEGPEIGLGEYKIGIIVENLTSLGCLTGNYIAEVELTEEYGILTIVRDDAFLKLLDTSGYQFLYLEKVEENGRSKMYRRAYDELGWTHGEDDATFERVVLGQILPKTTVTDFLANIDSTQINNVKIYDKDGNVLYDCGTEINMNAYVGTGAKVELILGGEAIDTVYLSVLGDVSGDGLVRSADAADISTYIASSSALERFALDEFKLAALIINNGSITQRDAATINQAIAMIVDLQDYFYHEET